MPVYRILDRRVDLRAKVGYCTRPLRLRREDRQERHLCRPGATDGYVNTISINPPSQNRSLLMCHAFRSLAIPWGRDLTKEEAYIQKLDGSTGASLKLTALNPNGRIWAMVAGGGASVVYRCVAHPGLPPVK